MNRSAVRNSRPRRLLIPALASALLIAMGLSNAGFPTAEDAEPYHAHILALAADAPRTFGPWEGRPIDVPVSAVELLRPNAMLSMDFRDFADRRRASFLVVQCKDARDLSGHWPPNCYKSSGYTLTAAEPRTWTTPSGQPLPGIEYTFDMETSAGPSRLVVANFLIIPGVGFVPDMKSVRDAGADPQRRSLGAAQVQVVTDGSYNRAQRDTMFVELLAPHWALVEGIAEPDAE